MISIEVLDDSEIVWMEPENNPVKHIALAVG